MFACALPLTAVAERRRPRDPVHIGFLLFDAPALASTFEEEMRRLGYVEGKNIVIEKRTSRPNTSDLEMHAAELARMDLELIVAGALPQALEVRKDNPAMPMVIVTCPGMISNGFARTLKRPGGSYTGIDEIPPGVTAKRLRLLKTAAPKVSRVALLSTTPGRGGHETQLEEADRTAKMLHLTVKPYRAMRLAELSDALAAIIGDGMDGLLTFQGALSILNRKVIIDFTAQHRLPAVYQSGYFVEDGGLMSWGPDQAWQFRKAARYVDRILKGARPGDLPVSYPGRYYLTINTSAALAQGIAMPRSLLASADHIVR